MDRLRRDVEFERVRKEGRTWSSPLVVLNAAANGQESVRCGFVTGKRVGKAVQRNRARRLMREAVRLRLPHISPGWDLVWIARAPLAGADLWATLEAVDTLLRRSKALRAGEVELPPLRPSGSGGQPAPTTHDAPQQSYADGV